MKANYMAVRKGVQRAFVPLWILGIFLKLNLDLGLLIILVLNNRWLLNQQNYLKQTSNIKIMTLLAVLYFPAPSLIPVPSI